VEASSTAPTRPERGRRARRATGDERERAILETFERELDTKSFHEISIDDLASGAGISRSTFYFYFPSKEAVLLTLLDRLFAEADVISDEARQRIADDPAEGVRQALTVYVSIFGNHRAVMRAGTDAQITSPEVMAVWNVVREGWVEMAANTIEDERARGAAPPGLPARDLANALLNMNEGVLHTSFAGDGPAIAEESVLDTLQTVWINAIYVENAPKMLNK
jgi:AcrR family transcriptional regulator